MRQAGFSDRRLPLHKLMPISGSHNGMRGTVRSAPPLMSTIHALVRAREHLR